MGAKGSAPRANTGGGTGHVYHTHPVPVHHNHGNVGYHPVPVVIRGTGPLYQPMQRYPEFDQIELEP